MDLYTTDMWEEADLSETLAGEDPEWINSMVSGYRDCYDIAQNWPQENLDRNPFTKVFGRHHVFFQCAKSVEEKRCTDGWRLPTGRMMPALTTPSMTCPRTNTREL